MIKMRLPNGFGSVTKLSGKRRKPWRARATSGWSINTETMKATQQHVNLGCYEKKIHAIQALTAYNSNKELFLGLLELYKKKHITLDDLFTLRSPKTSPETVIRDIEKVGTTLNQLYLLWRNDNSKYGCASKSDHRQYVYDHAYKLCDGIKHMLIKDITLSVLQDLVDTSEVRENIASVLKQLLKSMFRYAIIHNYITPDMDKVQYLDLSNVKAGNKNPSKRFSSDEIETIWKYIKKDNASEYTSVVLMIIYTGLRVSEMLDLKKSNVNLDKRYFKVVDAKTTAGIRVVPIAEKIVPFFEFWLGKNENENLISGRNAKNIKSGIFRRDYWYPLMDELGFKHKVHDARHTCVSLLKTANINDTWIKQIVGHKSQDITSDTYTEIEIKPLIEAINLI